MPVLHNIVKQLSFNEKKKKKTCSTKGWIEFFELLLFSLVFIWE